MLEPNDDYYFDDTKLKEDFNLIENEKFLDKT